MPVSVKQRAKANEQSPSLDTTCHSALMARSSAPLHNLQLHVNRYNMTPIQTLFSKRMDSAAQSVLPFPIDIGRDNPIRQRNAVIPHQTVIIVSVQRITEFISIELISPSEHSRISIFDKFVFHNASQRITNGCCKSFSGKIVNAVWIGNDVVQFFGRAFAKRQTVISVFSAQQQSLGRRCIIIQITGFRITGRIP